MDYLSWLTDKPDATDTIIVLNSVNLIDAAARQAWRFGEIEAKIVDLCMLRFLWFRRLHDLTLINGNWRSL